MDCRADPTFCQSRQSCKKLTKSLKSVSFNIEGTIFELSPEAYLHQGEGICQFAIAQNPLDKHNNGNFLFGDLFLKHFYSIYDYDQELISLGINKHSEGVVRMYPVDGVQHTQAKAEKRAINSAFQTAVDSEGLTGRQAMKGTELKLDGNMNTNKEEFAAREEKA